MIWTLTVIYFLLCSLVLLLGFWLYGKALTYFGKSGVVIKNMGGFVVYVLFSCVLVSPLLIVFIFIEQWLEKLNANTIYMIYFIFLYLLSAVPGGIYFKKYHFSELRKLGYFAKRR